MSLFKRVGVVGRLGSGATVLTLQRLIAFLQGQAVDIVVEKEAAAVAMADQVAHMSQTDMADHCDLVIVVGGDGSLLGCAREMCRTGVPLLGINRGRLGFLTDIAPDEIEAKVEAVLHGEYRSESRLLMECEVWRNAEAIGGGIALNDVVVHPGNFIRMVDFEVYIDGVFVYRQRSDGLIIATPTGSTAYNLSVGGPIMHPHLDALVVVPLNPHTLSSRPIVVHGDSVIRVVMLKQRDIDPQVTCDGQTHVVMQPGDNILVRKKPQSLHLIHPLGHDFYQVCRTKLGWATHATEGN